MSWSTRKRPPYTQYGIKRVPCIRCGRPSTFQWQICADNNVHRAVCKLCDIALNTLVLRFMRDPDAATKIAAYHKKVTA